MIRKTFYPRSDWEAQLKNIGFTFYSMPSEGGGTYWTETAGYEFTKAEIHTLETVTKELFDHCLHALDYVIQNKRLHYAMGKNQKVGSLKIPDKAYKILEYYEKDKPHNNGLIFPELKDCNFSEKFATQRTIAFKTSAIDKVLHSYVAKAAQIEKKLTMHLARHSFGSLAGDKIAIQMLQKLYRHSSVLTTISYQGHFIHKDADEALEAVLEI